MQTFKRERICLDNFIDRCQARAMEWDLRALDLLASVALRRLADDLDAEAAKAAADSVKMAADAATARAWAEELEVEP